MRNERAFRLSLLGLLIAGFCGLSACTIKVSDDRASQASPAPTPLSPLQPNAPDAKQNQASSEVNVRRMPLSLQPTKLAHDAKKLYLVGQSPLPTIAVIDISHQGYEALVGTSRLPQLGPHPQVVGLKLLGDVLFAVVVGDGPGSYPNHYYQIYSTSTVHALDGEAAWSTVGAEDFYPGGEVFFDSTAVYFTGPTAVTRVDLRSGQMQVSLRELPLFFFAQTDQLFAIFSGICCQSHLSVYEKGSGLLIGQADVGDVRGLFTSDASSVTFTRQKDPMHQELVTLGGAALFDTTVVPLSQSVVNRALTIDGTDALLLGQEALSGGNISTAHAIDRRTGDDCLVAQWSKDDFVNSSDAVEVVRGSPTRIFIATGNTAYRGLLVVERHAACLNRHAGH
jgi:hypothetical protein